MQSDKNSFLSQEELTELEFRSVGNSVKISRRASIYNPSKIEIGDFSRIDDFCVISAGKDGICIGKNVHISPYCSLIGNGRINLENYSGLSSRVSIYSSNDDYSGDFMTNPTVNSKYTNVTSKEVNIGEHTIIGSGSVVLPGVKTGVGTCIGSMSLVNSDCDSFSIYAGVPIRFIRLRARGLLQKSEAMFKDESES